MEDSTQVGGLVLDMSSATHNKHSPTGDGVKKRKTGRDLGLAAPRLCWAVLMRSFLGSAACVHCHRRKVRCDARVVGFPCSNCRTSKKPDCRIHEKKKRLVPRSILDPVPIRCRPEPSSDVAPKPEPPAPSARNVSPHHNDPQPASNQQLYNNMPLSGAPTEREAHTDLENRLVKLIDEEETDKREIRNGVRAIYVGHDLSNMSFLLRQQRDTDDGACHFAGNEIPQRQLQTGHDSFLIDALTLPEQRLADDLVEAYFAHANPGYPVVDEDFFMTQYRGRDREPPPILLLQSILLVGAHVTRGKAERDVLKEIFFRRAKWLFDNRVERNRDIMVQSALLLTWYSDSADDDVSANAYYWVGAAARIATGLGMHRNPVPGSFVSRDRRLWRRLWFLLLQFDVMVSVSYGRPQAM